MEFLYGLHMWDKTAPCLFLSIVAVSWLISGASMFVGGLLGFLFGIPKTLQHEAANDTTGRKSNFIANNDDASKMDYRPNTNLEQISDWLSKMLIGVGLTQITVFPEKLQSLAGFIVKDLGANTAPQAFVISIMVFFGVIGFLYVYLWTRLFLPSAFVRSDASAIKILEKRVSATTDKVENLRDQWEADAKALHILYLQLNPTPGKTLTQEELDIAVAAASSDVKAQIFYRASEVRYSNWKNDKEKMERTIPVFYALIKSDPENRFHANHGQLGYALKDRRNPDWLLAETELTTAIGIRGTALENGWHIYEFNRAICRIQLDSNFAKNQPATDESKANILSDLQTAVHGLDRRYFDSTDVVSSWMKINNVTFESLNT